MGCGLRSHWLLQSTGLEERERVVVWWNTRMHSTIIGASNASERIAFALVPAPAPVPS